MKKLIIAVAAMAIAAQAVAQKEIKPSLPKAEKALAENKLDEAKAIIDVTVNSQEFMVDKKGNPSRNAAKAWYLKGVIYAAMDTTKKDQFKNLDPNPFVVAKEAFEKSKEIDKDKTGSFVNDPVSGFPMLPSQVNAYFANAYLQKAVAVTQNDKDYKKAFFYAEASMFFLPDDTTLLNYAGVYFAPAAENDDKSIEYINKYIEKGGRSSDAYQRLLEIYFLKRKDNATALKVAKEARVKFPGNSEFPKYEMNIYLTEKKYDEAKLMVEEQVKSNPGDKEAYYLLGQLQDELKQPDAALASYNKALEIDPKYFEAALKVAAYYWIDAKKIKDEMGKLGTSKADMAKLQELDKSYVEKLKVFLPYLEKCEKLSPDDVTVLYQLLSAYTDLDIQANIARVKKKLKSLGEEVD